MRKIVVILLLCLLLIGSTACAHATWPDTAPNDAAEQAVWTFPVPREILLDPAGYLRLANAYSLLESDYIPEDLEKVTVRKTSSTAIEMRAAAHSALMAMFEDAKADGLTLYLHSGYRSYRTQAVMFENRFKSLGYDDKLVAKAGASDHQTGLGADIISKAWIGNKFNSKFAQTKEAQWMAANCARYGFILRYPEDKVEITEINFEPWHFRYVGIEAAIYIMDNDLTLEEFTDLAASALAGTYDAPVEDAASEDVWTTSVVIDD